MLKNVYKPNLKERKKIRTLSFYINTTVFYRKKKKKGVIFFFQDKTRKFKGLFRPATSHPMLMKPDSAIIGNGAKFINKG